MSWAKLFAGQMYAMRIKILCTLLLLPVLAFVARAAPSQPAVAVLVQDKTDPGFLGWSKAGAGTLSAIEAALQKGLSASASFEVLTRSQFDAVLAEQDLSYKNVVNDRARLGQLRGTDYIVIAALQSDRKNTRGERVSAYGITETQTTLSSEASLGVAILDVSSGKVVEQKNFSADISDNHEALPLALEHAATWLSSLRLQRQEGHGGMFSLRVAPSINGTQARGFDVFIDGNFESNTPAQLSVDGGVREITIKRADKTLWSNRVRVTRDLVLEPDLGG